jgi:scyllo-inositol 2-dehydrogenase (NADP+)
VPGPLNTVIVGYGLSGRSFHAHLISRTPGLRVYGVASRDAARRALAQSEYHCRTFESLDQVLDDPGIDLVVLATPSATHADMAIHALRAGKHVITDKPMCLNLAQADAMIAAARQANRLLNVFHNRRWDGDFLTLLRLLDDGELGALRWLETVWQRPQAPRGWRKEREAGGGRIYDLGSHLIDQILQLLGPDVQSVYTRAHYDFADADVESLAMLTLTFASGATAICDVSSATRFTKPRYLAIGQRATFIKYAEDPQEQAMRGGDIDAAVYRPEDDGLLRTDDGGQRPVRTVAGRWRNYYENVVAVITQGAAPAITLDQARRTIAVLQAAHQSARAGQPVILNPPADTRA